MKVINKVIKIIYSKYDWLISVGVNIVNGKQID